VNDADEIGAIVPSDEFTSVTLQPGVLYSIYIAGQSTSPNPEKTLLKARSGPSVGLVGDNSAENEALQLLTGVRLKGTSFPKTFHEAAEFNGVLHYRAKKSCNDNAMFATTSIVLEFAVSKAPSDSVKGEMRNSIYESLSTLLTKDKDLAQYVEEHMLKLDGITIGFVNQDGKCPDVFAECTVVATTALFKHLHNLDQGRLKAGVLGSTTQLESSVNSYLIPAESAYVGIPLVKAEFAITLTGVPAGAEMNTIQRNYFEEVTTNFLRNLKETEVLNTVVNEEIPETLFKEDVHPPESRTRRNLFSLLDFTTYTANTRVKMLRRRRNLQAVASKGKIRIITEIAAEGSSQELRNTVLGGIGNDPAEYSRQLISQQLRPIRMNEEDGDFFAELTKIEVKPYVPASGGSGPGGGNGNTKPIETESGGSAAMIACISLIVLSILWLFYRIYMDCFYSPFQTPIRMNDDEDEFKDEDDLDKSDAFKRPFYDLLRIPPFKGSFGTSDDNAKNQSKFRKGSKSFDNGHDLSCSSADIESSDEESISGSPRKFLGGPKRGRLTPSQSLPVQKRSGANNPPFIEKPKRRTPRRSLSSDGPKRGKLTATKSMPVQNRNGLKPQTDYKKQIKDTPKATRADKPQRSTPHRSSDGPKRGRLTATKSMPVQKRNGLEPKADFKKQIKGSPKATRGVKPQRSTMEGPKRGKLTATKSMPVQKRNGIDPKTDSKKQIKGAPKAARDNKPQRSTPHRSSDGPKRGKLTASRSMPMQKRNGVESTTDFKKQTKGATKATRSEKPRRTLSNPSQGWPNRGESTRNKSSPGEKHGVRRANSMPIEKKKKTKIDKLSSHSKSEKIGKLSSHSKSKKIDKLSSHSKSEKIDKLSSHSKSKKIEKLSSHSKSKKIDKLSSHSKSKKIEKRSSHSKKNKKQTKEKPRSSKSKPVKSNSKKRKSNEPRSEHSVVKLVDMFHGSLSDSDSADSSSVSENPSSLSSDSPRLHRKSSWTSDSASSKKPDSKRSYGKAGKIQYGGAKRFLSDVNE